MIRDPSDGTVREPQPEYDPEHPIKPIWKDPAEAEKWRRIVPDTGLRQPTRTDAQERLDASRDWIRKYHEKKEREHDEGRSSSEVSRDSGALPD